MRLLLISDTHGKLGIINELAEHVGADAVIHAGDFGFFDDSSLERLSAREIRLHVKHSDISQSEKDRIQALSRKDQIEESKKHHLLGGFQSYIDGADSFHVPVYAVWGNHEDKDVIERLFRGDLAVENLHLLHHRKGYRVGPAFIYGLGGNFLPGSKMMQSPIAGGGGKIWSTLSQYADLVETVNDNEAATGTRIFVSHVSPGTEPFVEFIGARTRAELTVSGHMGAPACMVWNPFTVSSVEEAEKRLQGGFDAVKKACMGVTQQDKHEANRAFKLIDQIPNETIFAGRGARAPRWHRRMTHINLPDAHVGYAILDVNEDGLKIKTFIR